MAGNRFLLVMGAITGFVVALQPSSCGGGQHYRTTLPAEISSLPRYLELRAARSVTTLHFPRGVYVLYALDDNGYYYRAPRKIVQHSFSGSLQRDGGIFVAKRNQGELSGYVILPSGVTRVGDLSRSNHQFRY